MITKAGIAVAVLALALVGCDEQRVSQDTNAPATPTSTESSATTNLPPPEAPAPVESTPVEPMHALNIQFTLGSAQLSDAAIETLTTAVEYLQTHPEMHAKLSGFTDQSGSADANKRLAERRVESTAKFFHDKGIAPTRIETVAMGEADTGLAPAGENPETWNRRVEVEFSIPPNS
jgi:outer membrane protein OmpA-like peptidoglycan-associated protein